MKNELTVFALALQFLTRIPVPLGDGFTPERMAASVRYHPLVGLIIGGICAAVFWTAHWFVPDVVAIVLALAAGLLVTGAFHEDGLADTFDGIGGGLTRQSALVIMRDSRLGTYGTLALVAALALKVGALAALPPPMIVAALAAAHCLSRLSSLATIATSRYVRDEGTGKPVAGGISTAGLIVASLTGMVVLLAWPLAQPFGALMFAVAGLVIGHIAMRAFFERKLGGYTGDTLGAVQQASEVGFYLGLAVWM